MLVTVAIAGLLTATGASAIGYAWHRVQIRLRDLEQRLALEEKSHHDAASALDRAQQRLIDEARRSTRRQLRLVPSLPPEPLDTERVELADALDYAVVASSGIVDGPDTPIDRHSMRIPSLQSDRAQLVEVLVEMLCHARRAVAQAPASRRHIRIDVERWGEEMVRVGVAHHRPGSEPADTERSLHGVRTFEVDDEMLPLAASAISARDLGGWLACETPLHGDGEQLVLLLPVDRNATATVLRRTG